MPDLILYFSGGGARNDIGRACPLLVPLVEEGWLNHPVTDGILREYLDPMLRQRIDTLILGCTHYPLLKRPIRKVAGPKVALVDSAETCAQYVREQLERKSLLSTKKGTGTIQPFVTDETDQFEGLAKRFLGLPTEAPWKVEV